MKRRGGCTNRGGFSLLEVVIVVAIIAILAAIGIPRMSRGSKGANDSALSGDLAVLRNAIELYSAEHGGSYPSGTDIADQLTQYSDVSGGFGAKSSTRIYGPYIRTVPPMPVGTKKGKTGIATATDPNSGWIYEPSTGKIRADAGALEADDTGKLYINY